MTTSYTTLLGLALPVPGELDGTWGNVVNNSITQLVEDSIANSATADVTASDWTLTTTGSGAANQARMAVLIPTGTPGVSRNIIAPSHNKAYIVINQSNGTVVVKGAATTGTSIAAGKTSVVAWNGADFILVGLINPAEANTFSGTQSFTGSTSNLAEVLTNAGEVCTVSATAATGTINYDVTTQSVIYYTTNASANWTVNFRGSSGTSLSTLMSTGQSVTVAFMVTQGSTAYYNSAVQVDGTTSGVTTRWLGGAPTAGNASGIDSYRYLIIKTGSATFTVLASNTQFKA
jgi:hypothetical protein